MSGKLTVTIRDDGPGFYAGVLDQLGDPYVSMRDQESEGKLHMGLGIFIAETLLQRTGAVLRFSNPREGGAEVAVRWKRTKLEATVKKRRHDGRRTGTGGFGSRQSGAQAPHY